MMKPWEKNTYILGRIGQTLINALGIAMGLLLLSVITGIIEEDNMQLYPHFVVLGALSVLLSAFISYLNDKKYINKLEEAYKNKDEDFYANFD